jgi:hypothetical protein
MMKTNIISNFKYEVIFCKKRIICFVNVKTDPRLGRPKGIPKKFLVGKSTHHITSYK